MADTKHTNKIERVKGWPSMQARAEANTTLDRIQLLAAKRWRGTAKTSRSQQAISYSWVLLCPSCFTLIATCWMDGPSGRGSRIRLSFLTLLFLQKNRSGKTHEALESEKECTWSRLWIRWINEDVVWKHDAPLINTGDDSSLTFLYDR